MGFCPSGVLSQWGFVPVGFCPVGFCPSGVLSQWGFVLHLVAVLTKDLSQENVLLSKRDGLSSSPLAIVYDAVDHQLLVSNLSSDSNRKTVDCFKL